MEKDTDPQSEGMDGKAGKKPKKGRFRETTDRLRKGAETNLKHRTSLDWRHDTERVCAQSGDPEDAPAIEELTTALRLARTGAALLDDAEAAKIRIAYDAQNPAAQFYPREDGAVITLNPRRTRGDLLCLLACSLRRAWQRQHGALVNPLSFEPDEAILVNRAQTADALMISVRIAWELKLVGMQDMWNHMAGSPMGDVSRAFEIKAQSDFRSISNGEAPRAAYDKFFEDCRTKAHDKRLIHQMLLDENGYMRRGRGTGAHITPDLFTRLGEVPGGRNYLALRAGRAPTDAAYATIEDRSNANFLWFIKFERSFHEKELQMVEDAVRLSAEIVDFAKWSLQHAAPETTE